SHRIATREEMLRLCDEPDLDLRSDLVARRFDNREICIASFSGARPVGYDWYSRGPIPLPDTALHLRFPQHLVYGYNSLTVRSHRGRGIAPDRWRFSHRELLSR